MCVAFSRSCLRLFLDVRTLFSCRLDLDLFFFDVRRLLAILLSSSLRACVVSLLAISLNLLVCGLLACDHVRARFSRQASKSLFV